MFCGWLNCRLNDDQQPVLQLFVQWVMPHWRLNKGPNDCTQDKFWALGNVVACVCIYPCVHMSWYVNPELVRAITYDPFKLGSPNMDQRCKTIWPRSLYIVLGGWLWHSKSNLTYRSKFHYGRFHHQSKYTTQQQHCSPERCDTLRDPCIQKKSDVSCGRILGLVQCYRNFVQTAWDEHV